MSRTKRVLLMCLGVVALATLAAVAAVLPGLARTVASRPQEPTDEQLVRQVWQVPGHVRCKSLVADPLTPGFYGREGLRIVANFDFLPGGLAAYRKEFRPNDWRPLPLPSRVTSIHRGAAELQDARAGEYLCFVRTRTSGGAVTWLSLDDPAAPKSYEAHAIAVLDTARERLVVVHQNHY
jgi:hypothetical protein